MLVLNTHKVSTIARLVQKIKGSRRAYKTLPNSTHIFIKDYYFQTVPEETCLMCIIIEIKSEHNKELLCIIN